MRYVTLLIVALLLFTSQVKAELTDSSKYNRLEELTMMAEEMVYSNPDKLDSIIGHIELLSETWEDTTHLMMARMLKGVHYAMSNDFAHALKAFHDVYEYAKTVDDKDLQINALHNMGGVYVYSGRSHKAESVFRRAMVLAEEADDQMAFANISMALGMALQEEQKYDSAMYALQSAMDYYRQHDEMHLAQSCMNEMAYILESTDNNRGALEIYNKMLALYPFNEDVRGEIITHQRKGGVLIEMGRMTEAVACLETSLYMADSVGYESNKDSTLVRLIKANASLGDVMGAEMYANRLIKFIQNKEEKKNEELLAYVETRYNLEEKALKNDELRASLEATQADLKRNQLFLKLSLALIVVLALSLVVILKRAGLIGPSRISP